MSEVYGDLRSLAPSDREALEKLTSGKFSPSQFIGPDFARRVSRLVAKLGVQIALLIGRDGRVEYVALGTRSRVYLPDLGRFRLSQSRLRRLRLVVFSPPGQADLVSYGNQTPIPGADNFNTRSTLAPEISFDLITDLEKLRFDVLLVLAVTAAGIPAEAALAYLKPNPTGKTRYDVFGIPDILGFKADFSSYVAALEEQLTKATAATSKKLTNDAAILVGVYTGNSEQARTSMDELYELALSANLEVRDSIVQRRRTLDPKTVLGKGKLEDVVLHCLDLGADLLVFDSELTPSQLRAITGLTELRVIDRSMLILDIFAQRAKSAEGRLQVELAQLKYVLPRLTDKDTGLSRLTGGIGGRGPGETKLEISRRRTRDRIADLEKRISKISEQRGVRRERRQSRGVPVIGIVGYTNAGKSTLLNALTKGDVLAEDKMFATLDPSSRRMRFPDSKEVIFVDTVGFIRELPKELINAFRATLEEVSQADMLIHLVDASNLEMRQQIEVVDNTLTSLGVADKPRVLVLNKTDLLSAPEVSMLANSLQALAISASQRQGLPDLIERIRSVLSESFLGQDPGRFTEIESQI